MPFSNLRLCHLGFVLVAICCLAVAANCNAQDSAPKKYSDQEKMGLDALNSKLDHIIVPAVKWTNIPFLDAVNRVRALAEENDSGPERGVSIFLKGTPASNKVLQGTLITLDFQNAPLRKVLEEMAKQAGLTMNIEPWAVSFKAAQ